MTIGIILLVLVMVGSSMNLIRIANTDKLSYGQLFIKGVITGVVVFALEVALFFFWQAILPLIGGITIIKASI